MGQWFKDVFQLLFDGLKYLVESILGFFWDKTIQILKWLWELVDPALRWVAEQIYHAVKAGLNFIPVPDFIQNIEGYWNAIPWAEIGYFLEPFKVGTGVTIILSAYIIRFGLKVLPWVGGMFR